MFRDAVGMPIDQKKSALQPTQILTKDNVGDIQRTTGASRQDALDQFKKLWQPPVASAPDRRHDPRRRRDDRGARSRHGVEDVHSHEGAVGRQHDHRTRRGSCAPGAERIGEVDPDQDPLRIPRARSGRWYPDPGQRAAVPVTGAVLPARMPVRAAGSRARPDAVGPGQHVARVGLPHRVRDDPGEGQLRAGQGRPGAAQPRHRPEGAWCRRSALRSGPGVAIARALREDPEYPALPARARRADRDAARRRGGQSPGPRQRAWRPPASACCT